jgi:hypothetical protein
MDRDDVGVRSDVERLDPVQALHVADQERELLVGRRIDVAGVGEVLLDRVPQGPGRRGQEDRQATRLQGSQRGFAPPRGRAGTAHRVRPTGRWRRSSARRRLGNPRSCTAPSPRTRSSRTRRPASYAAARISTRFCSTSALTRSTDERARVGPEQRIEFARQAGGVGHRLADVWETREAASR